MIKERRETKRLGSRLLQLLLCVGVLSLTLAVGQCFADEDPLQLVKNDTGSSYHYVGEDVEGFNWPVVFLDYYNDTWKMKQVRSYGDVDYYVGNRIAYGNSGKRYACSASIYHAPIGDVISFNSQNYQVEKSFTYNMAWQNDTRLSGCEYWLGADRFDNYYFRNAYIDLKSGAFGDHGTPVEEE
jgi:hypothetical protein